MSMAGVPVSFGPPLGVEERIFLFFDDVQTIPVLE